LRTLARDQLEQRHRVGVVVERGVEARDDLGGRVDLGEEVVDQRVVAVADPSAARGVLGDRMAARISDAEAAGRAAISAGDRRRARAIPARCARPAGCTGRGREVTVMFKITALAGLLAVAAPAAAMASPGRSSRSFDAYDRHGAVAPARTARTARTHARLDHREPLDRGWRFAARDDFGPRRYRPTWVPLSASLELGRFGRAAIEVYDPSTFTQLRLQAASGVARIDRVIIEFADGTAQIAEVRRVLDGGNDRLEVELDGNNRRIARVLVSGDGTRCGALQVYGI
jgi:hypothetical protein